jgi:hypothetical protein
MISVVFLDVYDSQKFLKVPIIAKVIDSIDISKSPPLRRKNEENLN